MRRENSDILSHYATYSKGYSVNCERIVPQLHPTPQYSYAEVLILSTFECDYIRK